MSLTSLVEDERFAILKNLIRAVKEHTDLEDYAVVIARTKKSKMRVKDRSDCDAIAMKKHSDIRVKLDVMQIVNSSSVLLA